MRELIIAKREEERLIALMENGVLVEKYSEVPEKQRLEGNIYLGKVQNVLQGMQAAFVDIGEGKNTFIHLKDALPKVDISRDKQVNVANMQIKDYLKPGMPILVQVKRDATSKKGARVSTHISLASRYLVLMPETSVVTISQKTRLLRIVKEQLPENCGAIIRTAAEDVEEEAIRKDIKEVYGKWKNILEKSQKEENYPRMIWQNDTLLKRILRDLLEQKIDQIITNDIVSQTEIETIEKELEINTIPKRLEQDVWLLHDLQRQLEKAESRKIWLKCGGFITIDKTEALTAIDVNSGKYVGTQNLEETVLVVNKEASIEIAKQLKLRDIGGIIIIDYIDMHQIENEEKIKQILEQELKKDRSKTQVLEFTKLNLLEVTRKHICSN